MESKRCNQCKKKKPINMFYKLRADKPWRRSKCTDCHLKRSKSNRKIRLGLVSITLVLVLSLLSRPSLSQRSQIVDSINYFREAPIERVQEAYGITLTSRFKPMPAYVIDDKLNKSAQRWAEKMARTGNYWHSKTKYTESIDAVQAWQGGYELSVGRFIVDKYVPNKGHRKHLLSWPDTLIGVGIATSKKGETFVCIQTTSSSSLQ